MDSRFPHRPLLLAILGLSFLGTTGAHAQVPFRVKDIFPGTGGSSPFEGLDVSGTLFFPADDGSAGRELWKSDGTDAGTVLVKDIYPGGDTWGAYSSQPGYLTNLDGVAIFVASDSWANNYAIWRTDGTEAGTVFVKDVYPLPYGGGCPTSCPECAFGNPRELTLFASAVLFAAADSGGGDLDCTLGPYNTELWRTDGTAAGTMLVRDILPGPWPSVPTGFTPMGNLLFFGARDVNGDELWKTDGTTQGTVLVKDVNPGSASSEPAYLTDVNGTLFFRTSTPSGLWKSDGTAAGTVLVKSFDGWGWAYYLTDVNGTLFFAAFGSTGRQLWKSDGTPGGTAMLKDGFVDGPRGLTNVSGTLFFSATDVANGIELWKSNGTPGGTVLVKDIYPGGAGNSNPLNLTQAGGLLYFTATTAFEGTELWKSDSTPEGTVLVQDVYPGPFSSGPGALTLSGKFLYFSADDGSTGRELWALEIDLIFRDGF